MSLEIINPSYLKTKYMGEKGKLPIDIIFFFFLVIFLSNIV